MTGGSDPGDPACAAGGESALPSSPSTSDPCQGPFVGLQEGRTSGIVGNASDDVIPRLSADGYDVAFLGNAPLAALGGAFAGAEPNSDLYVVDMHEPLTRVQALTPLTELAGGEQSDIAENGEIEDFDISASGQQLAFTTKRTVFPLGSPAYVSAPQASPGMLELFAVDLEDDTLTRVTEGFEGGPSEHPHEPKPSSEDPYQLIGDGALSPSFSDDGDTLAFTSTASNLVFGDGNTPPLGTSAFDGSDAFVVSRMIFTPTPTPQYDLAGARRAAAALSVATRRDGSLARRRDGRAVRSRAWSRRRQGSRTRRGARSQQASRTHQHVGRYAQPRERGEIVEGRRRRVDRRDADTGVALSLAGEPAPGPRGDRQRDVHGAPSRDAAPERARDLPAHRAGERQEAGRQT